MDEQRHGESLCEKAFCSLFHSARGRPVPNRENACRYVTMVSCLETSVLLVLHSDVTQWINSYLTNRTQTCMVNGRI